MKITVSNYHSYSLRNIALQMTFVARPNHLNSLLSKMTYESLNEGFDNISLTIYDGVGGNCLTEVEHIARYNLYNVTGPYSIHRDENNVSCHKVEKLIPIHVVTKGKTVETGWYLDEAPMQLWVAMITLVFSFVAVSLCSVCTRTRRKKIKEVMSKMGIEKGKKKRIQLQNISDNDSEYSHDSHQSLPDESDVSYRNDSSLKSTCEEEDIKYEYGNNYYDEDSIKIPISTSEWIQHFDPSSEKYYYENTRTSEVTWEKPYS